MSEKGLLYWGLACLGILIIICLVGVSLQDQTQKMLNPTLGLVAERVGENDTACDSESKYSLFPGLLLVAGMIGGATAGLAHSKLFKR